MSIDILCITHHHADHVLGLPGMLSTYNQCLADSKRQKSIILLAPRAARNAIRSLLNAVYLNNLHINFLWIDDNRVEYDFGEVRIKAVKLAHSVCCYGYAIIQPNFGHFNKKLAERYNVPSDFWSILQNGYTIMTESDILDISSINDSLGTDCKVCYATDTRLCHNLYKLVNNADLAILDGMYAVEDSKSYGAAYHLTFAQAASVAKECNVTELWLTHFSPSLVVPDASLETATDIFENTKCGEKGMTKGVNFRDALEQKKKTVH